MSTTNDPAKDTTNSYGDHQTADTDATPHPTKSTQHRDTRLPRFTRRTTAAAVAALIVSTLIIGSATNDSFRAALGDTIGDATGGLIGTHNDDTDDNDTDGDGSPGSTEGGADGEYGSDGNGGSNANDTTYNAFTDETKTLLADNDLDTTTETDTIDQRDTVDLNIAPTKGNNATMLAPGGTEWWRTVTSIAPNLSLYDVPAPEGVNWYAVTSGQSYASNSPDLRSYQAVHVAFADIDALQAFAENAFTDQTAQFRTVLLRGTILTFAPSWLDPTGEPYTTQADELDAITALKPTAASWNIHFGDSLDLITSHSDNAAALNDMVNALGFTSTTTWSGTASKPAGPWIGTINDYNPEAINFDTAATALASTSEFNCASSNICDTELNPLSALPYTFYFQAGERTYGQDPNYLPDGLSANTLDDVHLAGGIDISMLEGLINGTGATPRPPVGIIKFVIAGNRMTIRTPIGEATSLTPSFVPYDDEAQ